MTPKTEAEKAIKILENREPVYELGTGKLTGYRIFFLIYEWKCLVDALKSAAQGPEVVMVNNIVDEAIADGGAGTESVALNQKGQRMTTIYEAIAQARDTIQYCHEEIKGQTHQTVGFTKLTYAHLADILERLQSVEAENARLRQALEKIAYDKEGDYDFLVFRAREALEGKNV